MSQHQALPFLIYKNPRFFTPSKMQAITSLLTVIYNYQGMSTFWQEELLTPPPVIIGIKTLAFDLCEFFITVIVTCEVIPEMFYIAIKSHLGNVFYL